MAVTEKIFYNGDILTMEDHLEAEAVWIKDGKIEALGSKEAILALKTEETELVDLQGKTLMPAFIDAHSHISALAQTLALVSLSECRSIEEIIDKLKAFRESRELPDGKWIVGFGYDHNFLAEKRHPDRFDLDQVSEVNPVLISHVSGHMGIVNSLGLETLGIREDTPDPAGGRYGHVEGTARLNGYLEESAFINQAKGIMKPEIEELAKAVQAAQDIYLTNGITTVQEGLAGKRDLEVLAYAAENQKLKVDVVAYLDLAQEELLQEENSPYLKKYQNHLKIGGYKLVLDGSPQGKTAWLTKPYEGEESYRGNPTHADAYVEQSVRKALQENRQLLTHCNGDAAADQLIHAFQKAAQEYPIRIRPVMIHAQTVRNDQIQEMKRMGMIPSYFVAHVYYWGDIHMQNLGERAYHISPAGTTAREKLVFTLHQDTPVIAPNMLETVWCAVNRMTQSGVCLGAEERIGVYDALKAVTVNAAYQYFEEESKGSIAEGKQADLIILDRNPLKTDRADLKNIRVLETYKDGLRVWSSRQNCGYREEKDNDQSHCME